MFPWPANTLALQDPVLPQLTRLELSTALRRSLLVPGHIGELVILDASNLVRGTVTRDRNDATPIATAASGAVSLNEIFSEAATARTPCQR